MLNLGITGNDDDDKLINLTSIKLLTTGAYLN
jgi:hypothetical protein